MKKKTILFFGLLLFFVLSLFGVSFCGSCEKCVYADSIPVIITMSKSNYFYVYGQQVDAPNCTTSIDGVEVEYTYAGTNPIYNSSTIPPTLPGTYSVIASAIGGYSGMAEATYTIGRLTPTISGLKMENKEAVFDSTEKTIDVTGNLASHLNVSYSYKTKSGDTFGAESSTKPINTGIYKVIATFSVKTNLYYAEFETNPALESILTIKSKTIQTGELSQNSIRATLTNENGIPPNANLQIMLIDKGYYIKASFLGFVYAQTFIAKVVNEQNETIAPSGENTLTIYVPDDIGNLNKCKLFIYEQSQVIEKSFEIGESNSITFTTSSLGEFAIYSYSVFRTLWFWIMILAILVVIFIISLILWNNGLSNGNRFNLSPKRSVSRVTVRDKYSHLNQKYDKNADKKYFKNDADYSTFNRIEKSGNDSFANRSNAYGKTNATSYSDFEKEKSLNTDKSNSATKKRSFGYMQDKMRKQNNASTKFDKDTKNEDDKITVAIRNLKR